MPDDRNDNGHNESASIRGFYRIGEVSRLTDTKPFVLRYWETEFPTLQPVKSPKGHRLYRSEDVEAVLQIKRLLYEQGFTIAGARRHLREQGVSSGSPETPAGVPPPTDGEPGAAATEAPSTENRASATLFNAEPGLAESASVPRTAQPEPPAQISRKVLLDLRDSIRAFLTLLENE